MAGFTNAFAATTLDTLFPTSAAPDYIGYSTNGSSEFTIANLPRTAIGATNWASATVADPSVKQNTAQVTSAAVTTAGGTITHFAIFSASSAGTQKTDWQALDNSRLLAVGDSLQWAGTACKITLT